VDLLRHHQNEQAIRTLLTKTSPLRREGALDKLHTSLGALVGTEAFRISGVDWRYDGTRSATAVLHTQGGNWQVMMRKDDRWRVHEVSIA
jgi:hypothetical protein